MIASPSLAIAASRGLLCPTGIPPRILRRQPTPASELATTRNTLCATVIPAFRGASILHISKSTRIAQCGRSPTKAGARQVVATGCNGRELPVTPCSVFAMTL